MSAHMGPNNRIWYEDVLGSWSPLSALTSHSCPGPTPQCSVRIADFHAARILVLTMRDTRADQASKQA
jgi:hypothetical protein